MFDYSKLFKAYDMRGTTPDLTAEVYYLAGKALVEKILIPEKLLLKVNLFRDTRLSSPDFYKALYNGLVEAGAEVVLLGLGTTDMMYAACQLFNTPGGIVTASHNPKDDNGFKFVKKVPNMLGLEDGLDKVRDYVLENIESTKIDLGSMLEPVENEEAKAKVLDFFLEKVTLVGEIDKINSKIASFRKKMKVVVDTANGMGGFIMPEIAKLYPNIEFIPLYWELDGNFPNHPANPTIAENMIDLEKAVLEYGADLGVAFDGDADRVYFVDEKGVSLNGEFLVALLSKYMVKEAYHKPELGLNPAVVSVISYGRASVNTTLEANGVPILSKQGHTFVKAQMKKYNAIYGGEASGHHYFGDFGYMDSGAITLALFLRILIEKEVLPSALLLEFSDKYFVSGERNFVLPEGLNMTTIKEKIKSKYADGAISELDGITAYYLDWKFTIRGSNTEPLLRINLETIGLDKTGEKLAELKSVIGI